MADAIRAVRGRSRRAAACGALLATFAALCSCGQRGPLTLPDSARPIERLDPAAQQPAVAPAASSSPSGAAQPAPGAAVGTTPPQPEPESEDDRSQNGARPPENER